MYSTVPFMQQSFRALRGRMYVHNYTTSPMPLLMVSWNSGHATIHAESLYVSVIGGSPEMYSLRSFILTKSFPPQKLEPYVMQVAIVNQGQWLVAGGDAGIVKVYATATSKLVHNLVYEKLGQLGSSGGGGPRVQTVAVSSKSIVQIFTYQTALTGAGLPKDREMSHCDCIHRSYSSRRHQDLGVRRKGEGQGQLNICCSPYSCD